MLEIRDLTVSYGMHRALENVSVHIAPGEIAVVLGANGAGKSTLLRAISGLCEGAVQGQIKFDNQPILGRKPNEIVNAGIALVPEGRGIFGDMSVQENLQLGAYGARARGNKEQNLRQILDLFPKLIERRNQTARTMSGGEQQMVAIGRAMMSAPAILMLDEPSLGLSPLLVKELFQNLKRIRETGIGVLLVEQNAKQSLAIADRGYLLENGHVTGEDSAENLLRDTAVQRAYLGANASTSPHVVHDGSNQIETMASEAPPVPQFEIGAMRSMLPRADDLVGNVDDLVKHAEHVQTGTPQRGPASGAAAAVSSAIEAPLDELADRLAKLEAAASSARRSAAPASTPAEPPVLEQTGDADLPDQSEAEITRKPVIEVYRRKTSGPDAGKMIKIKGQKDG